ncbi:unnamed protein product [Ectocarpus sp. 13 AM-2016]
MTRPGSAEIGNPRGHTTGEGNIEQELLLKIGQLAKHHARNVQALNRLRSTTSAPPTTAWEGVAVPPPRGRPNPVELRRRATPKGDPNLKSARSQHHSFSPSDRVFTRVVDSSSTRKKLEPTVVKPFRGMETHVTAWTRKMRAYEELEIRTKKDEEEANARDRERLITAINDGREFSGVITRSNEMMARRRQRETEAEENDDEARRSHEFKARPLHIADEDWQTIKDRQSLRRKQRIQMRMDLMSSLSYLPRRMAMHALKRKAAASTTAEFPENGDSPSETKARTRYKSVSPGQIREVLARRQRLWDQQLAAARRKKKPVVPQVLPMEERENVYRQRAKERARRKQDKSLTEEIRQRPRRKKVPLAATVPVVPRSTNSFSLKTAHVRARLAGEKSDLKRQKQEELARRTRQQAMSKTISKVMRRMDYQQTRLARRPTAAEARQTARESQERYHVCLKENKQKLEQATRNAPTLWERHDAEVRKEAAKRIALSTMAERVFGAGSVGAERENLRGSGIDKFFDEEERALLCCAN